MKKLITISFLLAALALPALAQWQRYHLSSEDQTRFDSYFSRWQDYRQRNDRDQIISMEKRMLGVYAQYNIPQNTPFWRVASNARGGRRFNISGRDQARFDSYFSRWQDYRQRNDRDQIESMEKRMQGIYAQYNIPRNTPYFMVASNGRDDDWDRWDADRAYHDFDRDRDRDHDGDRDRDHDGDRDRDHDRDHDRNPWRGRLSQNDQARFDSYYSRWQESRQRNDRDQIESMEHRMLGIYDDYRIPHDVGFDQVASQR